MKYLSTGILFLVLFVGFTSIELYAQDEPNGGIDVTPYHPSVTELKIRGRMENQFAYSEGANNRFGIDAGNYNSFEMRRIRLGVQGTVYEDWDFQVVADILSNTELNTATLTYSAIPEANFTFGKSKARFGYEQGTASSNLLTIERTRLDKHLNGGRPIGLRMHGVVGAISYYLGLYNGQSTSTSGMGGGMESYLLNGSIEMDLGEMMESDTGIYLRMDYLHNGNESGYYDVEDAIAASGHFISGLLDIRAEYMTGTRHDQDKMWGFYVMPSYYVIPDTFQAVIRYENIAADEGLELGHNRYADRVPGLFGSGNEYYALYAGVNYYIYDNNLKWMFGVELAENRSDMVDIKGTAVTVMSGIRFRF